MESTVWGETSPIDAAGSGSGNELVRMVSSRDPGAGFESRVPQSWSAAMYDHYNLPDDPNPSIPTPLWVKLALGGPFLSFLLSTIIVQVAETIPSLAGPARALFLVAS